MAHRIRTVLLVLAAACPLAGQTEKPFQYNGSGYVDFGVGTCAHGVTTVSIGGGGDAFLWRGVTLGGDIGYYRFVERGSNGFGVGTAGIGYRFTDRNAPRRFDPFVNAGLLGGAFAEGIVPAVAFGGGVNYWFKRRLGLRAEVRANGFGGGEALIMFRVGFTFR